MIKKTTHKPITASRRPATSTVNRNVVNSRPITAARNITAGVQNRRSAVNNFKGLTKEQADFVRVIQSNIRKECGRSINAATNTSNIAAKPDFLELVPLFSQKLLVPEVFGTVAMNSRAQFIPFFKFVAENEKGETAANTVLSSPFANNQGKDPNFTGRLVKNEQVIFTAPAAGDITADSVATANIVYTPILPGTVSIAVGNKVLADTQGDGVLYDGNTVIGEINYAFGGVSVEIGTGKPLEGVISDGDAGYATYQYDNETIGNDPHAGNGTNYGAKMARGNLVLSDITLTAEARELACYWSVYAAFASQKEYGANLADTAKEAAISEITAEINSDCFQKLAASAQYAPQFNFDASPVLSGAVYPTDYLNQIKLKLGQAKMAIYQATRLSTPNRLVVGTTAANYLSMVNGFTAEGSEEHVGPYKLGRLDDFEIFVDPNYDPQLWVMACKSSDIRRNSGLFGEFMPIASTDAIGLANGSVQQGLATMYACEVVNPATVVSGRILGSY